MEVNHVVKLPGSIQRAFDHILETARNERGNAVVLTAISLIVCLGFAGLAVDGGLFYVRHQRLQTAADAAALAAARRLPAEPVQAYADAVEMARKNAGSDQVVMNWPYQADAGKVEVVVTEQLPLQFMRVLGFSSVEGKARSVAGLAPPQAFQYALFSGSRIDQLRLTGSGLHVNGNVHTNDSVRLSGSNHYISGRLEAVDEIHITGSSHYIGTQVPNAPYVEMPAFDAADLRARATEVRESSWHVPSNQTINGIIFVQGDVHLSGTIQGVGAIVATGDIYISGHLEYQSSGSALSLIAGGDVHISGSSITVDGIIYAPNGEIEVSGSSATFNGALVAQQVEISGSDATITYDPGSAVSLPYQRPRLSE